MAKGEAEELGFVAGGHAGCGGGDGDGLERDHLAHNPARGVGRRHQDRWQVQGFRGRTTWGLPRKVRSRDVSLPVRNTASHPSRALEEGEYGLLLLAANARPIVAVAPQKLSRDRQGQGRSRW